MEPESQLLSRYVVDTFVKATPEKRTGRKSMSRRSGQNGSIQKEGKWYVVRFWKDVAGQEKRHRAREKICPISGPGSLSASERKRKVKEIIAASRADTAEYFEKVTGSKHGITFREQAGIWGPVYAYQLGMLLEELAQSEHRAYGARLHRQSCVEESRRNDGEGWAGSVCDKVLHKRCKDGCGFGGQ